MKLKLVTAKDNRRICAYKDCTKNPLYITETGKVKKGSTCVEVKTRIGNSKQYTYSYYCRECVDKLYQDMKFVLNSNLWIFK